MGATCTLCVNACSGGSMAHQRAPAKLYKKEKTGRHLLNGLHLLLSVVL